MPDSGSGTGTAIVCASGFGGETLPYTLLSVDHYAWLMAIHPDAFNQCVNPDVPYPGACERVWIQYGWLDNTAGRIVGRMELAQAILTAEEQIAYAMGFWPAPGWSASEEHTWPRPARGAQTSYPPLQTNWGYVISGGQRALTTILADAPVAYSDANGDGYLDTATITLTAAQMAAASASREDVAVFHVDQTHDDWLIRDLEITEDATTGDVTIRGWRSQFVDRNLWEVPDDIDITVNGNFVGAVDVYRRWTDPSQPAQVVWQGGTFGGCATTLCADTCQTACISVEKEREGIVRAIPGTYASGSWSLASFQVARLPDKTRLWYEHGLDRRWTREKWRIRPDLAEAIARLANTLLPAEPCGCDQTKWRWQRDRQERDLNTFDAAQAMHYFGTTMAGALFAWSVCKRHKPLALGGALT